MKRIYFLLSATIISILALASPNVSAATPKEIGQIPSAPEISENQIVQVLPEGGYIAKDDGSSNFDSEMVQNNGGTLMTYGEYLEKEQTDTSSDTFVVSYIQFRSASPSKASGNPKVLKLGEFYQSNPFYERGWRFSELKFKAADGTGTWLLWKTYKDGGVVGNEWEAYQTYQSGQSIGRAKIEANQSQYVNGNGSWLFFYTYNPISGSGYTVYNK